MKAFHEKRAAMVGMDEGLAVGAAVVGLVDELAVVETVVGMDEGLAVGAAVGLYDNSEDDNSSSKITGGAQDSIDDEDEDNDGDEDDDSSPSFLDDDDNSDKIGREYQRTRETKIAWNHAHLTKLGLNNDLESKKRIKRKSTPRSLAPDGLRRRNPVRTSRTKEIRYEEMIDNEDEGSSEGGVPSNLNSKLRTRSQSSHNPFSFLNISYFSNSVYTFSRS